MRGLHQRGSGGIIDRHAWSDAISSSRFIESRAGTAGFYPNGRVECSQMRRSKFKSPEHHVAVPLIERNQIQIPANTRVSVLSTNAPDFRTQVDGQKRSGAVGRSTSTPPFH